MITIQLHCQIQKLKMLKKCWNVEDINIVASSDDHESNHDEFYESESKSPVTQIDSVHCPTILWMVQSNQSWNFMVQINLGTKMRPNTLIQIGTMSIPG